MIPPAERSARPTSALVKGAIFNILRPEQVKGVRALDMYAGSGSLGIEALSRGCSWADFVEQAASECAIIRRNLKETGFAHQAKVYCMSVERALETLQGPYGLVLMDPPYKLPTLDPVLEHLAASRLLESDAVVVVGHSKRQELKPNYGDMVAVRSRRYGDSQIHFFAKGG